jgi:hypothetical protein
VADHPLWRAQNAGRPGGGWDVGALPPDLATFLEAPAPPWHLVARFRFGAGALVLFARSDTIAL